MVEAPPDIGNDAVSLQVPDAWHGGRLDHFLMSVATGCSRSQLTAAIRDGALRVNGSAVKAGYRLKSGDIVAGRFAPMPAGTEEPDPQQVDFSVLYEDEALLVVDKPAGLVVHPGCGNRDRTLVNGLLYRYADLVDVGDRERPGVVHRLDKDTSGLLVIARTREVHRYLVQMFKERQVNKLYLALVHGAMVETCGVIDAPIGRHPVQRQKMAVRHRDGRHALSRWCVVRQGSGYSLLEVSIETGRTHQIRVHLSSIGHPVAGDVVYGSNRDNGPFGRQMLHAWQLRFQHPLSGQELAFEAPLPDDFRDALSCMGGGQCLLA